jgi:hypothetical protein
MAALPDAAAVVNAAADAVEARYGVTIHPEARNVLLRWADAHPELIERMVHEENWSDEQFVTAAANVLDAAAIRTLNPPGALRYEVEPEGLVRDTDVGAYATRAALPENCPFYGGPGC